MNNWNIPNWLELKVIQRDINCVYCGIKFDKKNKKNSATWEHIINDAKIITEENIALCCCSCNASKGAKKLSDWLNSNYCNNKKININNVSLVVKRHLK